MTSKDVMYLCIGIGIMTFGLFGGIGLYNHYSTDKRFDISTLNSGVGYQICTASIEAPFLYEKGGNIGFQIYQNTTQEQLDKWIEEYPNTIIMQGSVCIGNRLEIRG